MMAPRLPSETPRTVKTLIILWTAGQTGAKVHSIMEFPETTIYKSRNFLIFIISLDFLVSGAS